MARWVRWIFIAKCPRRNVT